MGLLPITGGASKHMRRPGWWRLVSLPPHTSPSRTVARRRDGWSIGEGGPGSRVASESPCVCAGIRGRSPKVPGPLHPSHDWHTRCESASAASRRPGPGCKQARLGRVWNQPVRAVTSCGGIARSMHLRQSVRHAVSVNKQQRCRKTARRGQATMQTARRGRTNVQTARRGRANVQTARRGRERNNWNNGPARARLPSGGGLAVGELPSDFSAIMLDDGDNHPQSVRSCGIDNQAERPVMLLHVCLAARERKHG